MKILCVFLFVVVLVTADDGVLNINIPNVVVKAQTTGNITLQSELSRDLYLEPGPGGKLIFDNEDILQIIKIAQSLPPVWLPHAHNGFYGTFEGGQTIHIKLEARDPDGGVIVYTLVAGDLPTGITIDKRNGYINGILPDIERSYSFTIRAMDNNTKYADSVFKMEVLSFDNCKSNPCYHSGTCKDFNNNTYNCLCSRPYGGHRCNIDCRSQALGVGDRNKIPDGQMSAYLSQGSYLAANGRYGRSPYWCGTNNNAWLQVDLGVARTVYRTRYQSYNSNFYTGSYTMSYSVDGVVFHPLNDTNGIHLFRGGTSTYTEDLPTPTVARFLRYHPKSYHKSYYPCMRVELYGC